jgi:hypothetical protein
VHVRAVALERGDLEILQIQDGRDFSGRVAASDAAGGAGIELRRGCDAADGGLARASLRVLVIPWRA